MMLRDVHEALGAVLFSNCDTSFDTLETITALRRAQEFLEARYARLLAVEAEARQLAHAAIKLPEQTNGSGKAKRGRPTKPKPQSQIPFAEPAPALEA
jgi:hypothetical protein